MKKYILSIDQGTTSSRAIIFDKLGNVVHVAQKEFTQYFPNPGWVEHDPNEIFNSVVDVVNDVVLQNDVNPKEILSIGITNQRETTVVWNKETGDPVYNAIVWQSRQTSDICEDLRNKGYEELIKNKTGLKIDAYFSASKIRWILDHIENGQELAEAGQLLAGTIDSWLIYKLSGKKVHATDYTNASRTMLFNIYDLKWDEEICELLNIPLCMLPEVKNCSDEFCTVDPKYFFGEEISVNGVAGDQQSALFGQKCFEKGNLKNTYGTGCFLLMNTGENPFKSNAGLVTTIAWGYKDKISYALEGSVFVAGSSVQWLRDQLHFFDNASKSEQLALESSNDDIVVVPAFVGLGAPYWDENCRGAIYGLTRDSKTADITRATLKSIAFQVKDIVNAMQADTNLKIEELKVDGGACRNDFLMQFQSDLLDSIVVRPVNIETTALGAAYFAGLYCGFWKDFDDIKQNDLEPTKFMPHSNEDIEKQYQRWLEAIKATRLIKY